MPKRINAGSEDEHHDENDLEKKVKKPRRGKFWPFIKKPIPGEPDHGICARCRTIDFAAIFNLNPMGVRREGLPVFDTGNLQELSESSKCSFCRMLLSIKNPEGCQQLDFSFTNSHLRAYTSLKMLRLPHKPLSIMYKPSIVIALMNGPPAVQAIAASRHNQFLTRGLILPLSKSTDLSTSTGMCYEARMVQHDRINYSLLRHWIQSCQTGHPFCTVPSTVLPGMKVIDCKHRKVIPLTEGMEYITLSYVWGSSQYENGHVVNGQSSLFPQTIDDAIRVVLKIQQRYLWVDKYCIDQNDIVGKHHQIRRMADIYEGALVTIVALGADSSAGLPGVSHINRSPQPTSYVSDHALASSLPELAEHLRFSSWAQRGWTYQEALLSRRCMIFSKHQVYFVCRHDSASEAVLQPTFSCLKRKRPVEMKALTAALFAPKEFGLWSRPSLEPPFFQQVASYAKRSLTFDGDALDAFRGLLTRACFRTYWGIPFIHCDQCQPHAYCSKFSPGETDFITGLLWTSDTSSSRREPRKSLGEHSSLASWSWVSVRGEIYFSEISYHRQRCQPNSECRTIRFIPSIWIEDRLGSLQPLSHVATATEDIMISEQSNFLVLRTWYTRFPQALAVDPVRYVFNRFNIVLNPEGKKPTHRILHTIKGSIHWDCKESLISETSSDHGLDAILVTQAEDKEITSIGLKKHYTWLLIKWQAETAYRIGILNLSFFSDNLRFYSEEAILTSSPEIFGAKTRTVRLG